MVIEVSNALSNFIVRLATRLVMAIIDTTSLYFKNFLFTIKSPLRIVYGLHNENNTHFKLS